MRSFDERLRDIGDAGCVSDVSGRGTVLLAFGGLGQSMGVPPFEFFNLTVGYDVDRIFVRDTQRGFYHRGVTDVGRTIVEIRDHVAGLIPDGSRVITIGVSAGGYAALLFGTLLGVDEVHAISPITCLTRGGRLVLRDRRWPAEMRAIRREPLLQPEYLDLRAVAAAHGLPPTSIYVARDNRVDRRHTGRLADRPEVTVHLQPGDSHLVVKQMRADGTLEALVARSLAPG
ncbi:MAG TPA: hypothetical protein VK507_15160 [Iamia sp.]|nr:hypothetical protein [Iamia sp.]